MNMYALLVPAGSDTQVQYNNGSLFGGDSALTWDDGAAKALTIGNCAVLGSDSAVYQPNADSTTFFQVKNAAGTTFITGDSTNERLTATTLSDGAFFVNSGVITIISGSFLTVKENLVVGNTDVARSQITMDRGDVSQPGLIFKGFEAGVATVGTASGTDKILRYENESSGELNVEYYGTVSITTTTPYLTLHNSTHEDSDGGRESRLNFKGEQSGGEETTLVRIEARHDGAADDQKGEVVISTNDGADADTPTDAVFIDSSQQVGIGNAPTIPFDMKAKIGMTSIGGLAIKLTNTTGAVTVQGQTVKADPTTDDAVILTAADDDECIGVFLDAGVADDAEAWVVVAGIADVAMGDNEATTAGNWVETNSTEAGYADATAATPAAAPQHFNEIGHCIETVAAGGGGTHILARCVLHFN